MYSNIPFLFYIRRGLHQSGYVIWFTALFPYVVMITLLIKALTLDGAMDGLRAYVDVRTPLSLAPCPIPP